MIDLHSEQLVSFADAPKHVPSRPNIAQIFRWAQRGLRGTKLEWMQIGGRRYTSIEALDRFFVALTKAAGGEATTPKKINRRAAQAAERELQAAGFEVGGDAD